MLNEREIRTRVDELREDLQFKERELEEQRRGHRIGMDHYEKMITSIADVKGQIHALKIVLEEHE
jgi:tetrahydromethanopterin S-methyltransferase subunit G